MSEITKKCTDVLKEQSKLKTTLVKGNTIMGVEGTYELPEIQNLTPENIKSGEVVNHITGTYKSSPTFISFYYYKGSTLDLSGLDTQNITSMGGMFNNCTNLTSLDLSSFNTSNVTRMAGMFNSCSKLTSLDLSSFNTSKITDMTSMFSGCSSLTSLNISSFDTSNVTNMQNMFWSCRNITSLDLSNFDTSNATNISTMFSGCSKLTLLDISSWDLSNEPYHNSLFSSVPTNCTIYVKDQTTADLLTSWDNTHTYTIKS